MASKKYRFSVFVNCPFDNEYKTALFPAIIFTIQDCGFIARSALEVDDATRNRLDKIYSIIKSSKFGIHDISRTDIDPDTQLPRFNMPFELGIFLAAQKYGIKEQKNKKCLILDKEPYRFRMFISDIAGNDPKAHDNKSDNIIKAIRDWLNNNTPMSMILLGQDMIRDRYNAFQKQVPAAARQAGLDPNDLQFLDLANLIFVWIESNPKN